MSEKLYDAFISYSHQDLKWGRWLQKKLENYRISREFLKENQPAHLRIFRDQTDLAGVELHDSLKKALDASRYLIVVCSPASAQSHWVGEEIRSFLESGGAGRIIPYIVDGEPKSDDPGRECFNPALLGLQDQELLGFNVQEIGKSRAALKVMSVLLDVRFNRLVDRDKQRRFRSVMITSVTAALLLAAGTALIWHNITISRRNQELVYDNYAAILLSLKQVDMMEPEDIARLRGSAEAGNTQAMLLLADCCLHGWGVEEDRNQYYEWMRKAADLGDPSGMEGLTYCYLNGLGTQADPAQAFAWSVRASDAGNKTAMLNTAIFLENGTGTEADPEKALEYYIKASEAGNDLAMYNLARCYMSGMGTEPSPEKAFFWMQKLAGTGNVQGMYNLALMYQSGYGTAEDPEQVYYWFRRAAESGDANAMYCTGCCLENHYGVDEAYLEWYRKAADAGSAEATEALARLQGGAAE